MRPGELRAPALDRRAPGRSWTYKGELSRCGLRKDPYEGEAGVPSLDTVARLFDGKIHDTVPFSTGKRLAITEGTTANQMAGQPHAVGFFP